MDSTLTHPVIAKLRTRYMAYSLRERRLILIMCTVVGAGLLWSWFAWQSHENTRLDKVLPQSRARLASLQDASAEITRLKAKPPLTQTSPAQLVDALQASAQAMQLSLSIRNIDGGLVQVSGKEVSFDIWISWLAKVQQTLGMRLASADVVREGNNVRVESQLSSGQ
ncbi:type II secretion system protein GspM [Uliginosibacterium gangwonense]|uniref:type II secretion system protein GspM n=1 Tax=Uliginosibacterium gangwonense TaxID=392736 RepID=UPI0003628E28|nr:type II secretion system protein GspM [Uliginosibacterium gangwonense]